MDMIDTGTNGLDLANDASNGPSRSVLHIQFTEFTLG
jgi:hypothetical protein